MKKWSLAQRFVAMFFRDDLRYLFHSYEQGLAQRVKLVVEDAERRLLTSATSDLVAAQIETLVSEAVRRERDQTPEPYKGRFPVQETVLRHIEDAKRRRGFP